MNAVALRAAPQRPKPRPKPKAAPEPADAKSAEPPASSLLDRLKQHFS
jgi:hypothetical protein